MKRRLFFRSLAGALASVALSQSIACEKLKRLVEPILTGWVFSENYASPCGRVTGHGKGETWDYGIHRRVIILDGWFAAERFDGTTDQIVKLPVPGDGRTITMEVNYDRGDGEFEIPPPGFLGHGFEDWKASLSV